MTRNAFPRIPAEYLGFWITASLVCAALWIGWSARNQVYLEAESGVGYALGIVGGVMMLLLLLYPMRKRLHIMSQWYSVKLWFRVHMVCGAFGPVLILYHANFSLGSTNSSVALFSMLIVAGSGLVGRYLYHRIGYRKLERRERLAQFRDESDRELRGLQPLLQALPDLRAQLDDYSRRALQESGSFWRDVWWLIRADVMSRKLDRDGCNQLGAATETLMADGHFSATEARALIDRAKADLRRYIATARQATEFACLQEFFSLWHHLHLPLFAMMVVTGITHVVAVHWY